MRIDRAIRPLALFSICLIVFLTACSRKETVSKPGPTEKAKVTVNWDKVVTVSKTTPTLQVVVNPPLRRGTKIHDRVFQALHELGADYVRYVPWLPYPKLGVAELEPPQDGKTSWDFSLIDPMMEDLMNATAGHSVIINFSTIPQWMFKTEKPVPYPADPDEVNWEYEKGTEFRDASLKEVGDYYARLVSWYTKGGFTDEYGKRHESGHHYKIEYWEVLNEVDFEHHMSPETYTRVYDAIVSSIRHVEPQMKFVGVALAGTSPNIFLEENVPGYFEYFLNPKNHKPGIPVDMISYHFYANPTADQGPEVQQYTVFDQAAGFLNSVRYLESIRQRLSPKTQTDLDELGCIPADDNAVPRKAIPDSYWNLCGAVYGYLYGELARFGIDVAGESQMVGYPSQFPGVSMVDWNTGQPNARYWVLKLLHDNFGPGDKLVDTTSAIPHVYAQGFVTRDGKRKLLLVNERDRDFDLSIAGSNGAEVVVVDQTTGFQPPATANLNADQITLRGLAVAVVTLPK
ncbi:MAG: glycosyl hydrolase family 39 [Terriglobia bacterium]